MPESVNKLFLDPERQKYLDTVEEAKAIQNYNKKPSVFDIYKEQIPSMFNDDILTVMYGKKNDTSKVISKDQLKVMYPEYPDIYAQDRTDNESKYMYDREQRNAYLQELKQERDVGPIADFGYGVASGMFTPTSLAIMGATAGVGKVAQVGMQASRIAALQKLGNTWYRSNTAANFGFNLARSAAENAVATAGIEFGTRAAFFHDNYAGMKDNYTMTDFGWQMATSTIMSGLLHLATLKKAANTPSSKASAASSGIDPEHLSKFSTPTEDGISAFSRELYTRTAEGNPLTNKAYRIVDDNGNTFAIDPKYFGEHSTVGYENIKLVKSMSDHIVSDHHIEEINPNALKILNLDDKEFSSVKGVVENKFKTQEQLDTIPDRLPNIKEAGFDGVTYTNSHGQKIYHLWNDPEVISRESVLGRLNRRTDTPDIPVIDETIKTRPTNVSKEDFSYKANGIDIESPEHLDQIVDPYRRESFIDKASGNFIRNTDIDNSVKPTVDNAKDIHDSVVEKAQDKLDTDKILSPEKDNAYLDEAIKEASKVDNNIARTAIKALTECERRLL